MPRLTILYVCASSESIPLRRKETKEGRKGRKETRQAKRNEGMHFLLSVHKPLGSSTKKVQVPSIHFLDSANSFYHAHTPNFSGESALGRETQNLCYSATFWKAKERLLIANLLN